jgi:NAD(P)-dependent dehydrogenase (short-subunit alcohol dehydrogenase family)
MKLEPGKVAVVTGAASGIGFALAERFARSGLDVVLADVDERALAEAASRVGRLGVETLAVRTDVSDAAALGELAEATLARFGCVNVVCNNAGVGTKADPWFGPLSAWTWVLGVNLWGVIHGIRTFLPILMNEREAHIVNTASIAGLLPFTGPIYDASKHAVVAISEDLFRLSKLLTLPVGVSVVCPGWVRTGLDGAERNWPAQLGETPPAALGSEAVNAHTQRAIAQGMAPADVAEEVASAIAEDRFWVLPSQDFVEVAERRWKRIAQRANPEIELDLPGMPSAAQIAREFREGLMDLFVEEEQVDSMS